MAEKQVKAAMPDVGADEQVRAARAGREWAEAHAREVGAEFRRRQEHGGFRGAGAPTEGTD